MQKKEAEHRHELGKAKTVANTDPLTGVKSKHAYHEFISNLGEDIAIKSCTEFAIAVCDVNNLKYVNDHLGHKAGDEYIKKACDVICTTFKHSPVFRIGGDEFVVVLTGQDYENRLKLSDEFNSVIEKNLGIGEVVIALGLSEYNGSKDSSINEVFERADFNMYARKKELKSK